MMKLTKLSVRDYPWHIPKSIRVSRVVVWVQTVGLFAAGAIQMVSLIATMQLSTAELTKVAKANRTPWTSHADVPYVQLWLIAGLLTLCGIVLGYLGWQILSRRNGIRQGLLVVETIVIVLGMAFVPTGNCTAIFGLPGVAVLVSLLVSPGKHWFDGSAA